MRASTHINTRMNKTTTISEKVILGLETILIECGIRRVQIEQSALGFFRVDRSEQVLGGWYATKGGRGAYEKKDTAINAAKKWVAA